MAFQLVLPCPECDDPMVLGVTGWGRCRSCGHETLRDAVSRASTVDGYIAASVAQSEEQAHISPPVERVGAGAAAGRVGAQALGLSPYSISDKR